MLTPPNDGLLGLIGKLQALQKVAQSAHDFVLSVNEALIHLSHQFEELKTALEELNRG